jgi:hypothetical protein
LEKFAKAYEIEGEVKRKQGLAALALVNFADEYEIEGDRQLEDVDGSGRCRMWSRVGCGISGLVR